MSGILALKSLGRQSSWRNMLVLSLSIFGCTKGHGSFMELQPKVLQWLPGMCNVTQVSWNRMWLDQAGQHQPQPYSCKDKSFSVYWALSKQQYFGNKIKCYFYLLQKRTISLFVNRLIFLQPIISTHVDEGILTHLSIETIDYTLIQLAAVISATAEHEEISGTSYQPQKQSCQIQYQ